MARPHGGQFRSGRRLVRLTCAKPASPRGRRAFSRLGLPAGRQFIQPAGLEPLSRFHPHHKQVEPAPIRAQRSPPGGPRAPPSGTLPLSQPRRITILHSSFARSLPVALKGRAGASPPPPQAKSKRPWLASLRPHHPHRFFLPPPLPGLADGQRFRTGPAPGPDTAPEDNTQ
jgi:hypothetical protein